MTPIRWRRCSGAVESTGSSLTLRIPQGEALPEFHAESKVPAVWNAFERNHARAYAVGFSLMVTMENLTRAMDLVKRGETKVSTLFEVPAKGHSIGVGFWGAGPGFPDPSLREQGPASGQLPDRHAIDDQRLPAHAVGEPGPYEQAVMNTRIVESNFTSEADFQGIAILRAIRSFDPCMPCTTHVMVEGSDRVVTREVTTCACGID